MSKLTNQEVVELFRGVIRGEVAVSLANPMDKWNAVYAGNVGFLFGDWFVVFFNDADELDYTDRVVDPSSDQWDFGDSDDPLDMLTDAERGRLEQVLKGAE